jgi:DNA helicase-2/ATP-dependent DNA helicase PcrA
VTHSIVPSPEQAAVRDYPLLPLRVTAGAGTGKTTTIALRLAALVQRGELDPEQALGITFTNKAAEELTDRLRSALPGLAEEGREIEVTTYHGFALGLLREFGPLVGVERTAGIVTPGYARQLLRDALGEGPRDALDLTAPGMRVDELVTLSGQLGDHLVTAETLADDERADDATQERVEMADALVRYGRRNRRLGVVDYADLIARAHQLVSEFPDVADRIRSRYRVVLLDEYQDTNPAQRELLRGLFGGGFPVTAVGDPDQTIYEWRGASLENFAAFGEHFAEANGTPARDLPLSFNRRSGSHIVALANAVRSEIAGVTGLERLRALEEAPEGVVEAAWFHSAVHEARWIAGEVVRLHDEEAMAWHDIGVLFRRHRQIGLVREALEREGVPVEVASLGGLLDVPEVSDLHAWLRILARPDDAPALMRVLLGRAYRLGVGDLAPLAAWVRARHQETEDDDLGGIGWALLEAVDRLEDVASLSDEARRRLGAFAARYRELLEEAQGASLVELSRTILDRTGAWPEVEALDDAARLSARLNLYRFLDLAEDWSPMEGAPSLDAFVDYLDLLMEDRATDELDTARVSGEDAVALLTVHRAKGLEWPVVFLPALCHDIFPSRARVYEDPRRHPQFLPHEYRLDHAWLTPLPDDPKERKAALQRGHLDQEWRTAYVAVTRAALRLVCTGAWWYTERTPRNPSRLYELAATVGTELQRVSAAGDPPSTLRLAPDGTAAPDPVFPAGWLEALREGRRNPETPARRAAELGVSRAYDAEVEQLRITLEGLPDPPEPATGEEAFRTSVTALVTFASCPQRFHWSEVDRLPRRPSSARRAGVELHRRIELHNRGTMPLEEAVDGFFDVPDDDDPAPHEGGFAAFRRSRFASARPRWVEAPFELALDAGRLTGRIDAIYEPDPDTWEIVDFKAGRRRDDPALAVQLEAYALAVREAGFAPDPPRRVVVTFAYLGRGLDEVSTSVDDAWLAAARLHVTDLLAGASAGRRSATPGDGCRRCDFVQFCEAGTTWLQAHPHDA